QSGTNKVGTAHTFTVFVEENNGTGWAAAAGETVNSTESGVGTITGGTCGPTGPTDAGGHCTVIVNSSVPGTDTVNATSAVSVGGITVNVDTAGYGAHDISNVKTWVNARISIGTSGTNKVGTAHTFTVTVEADSGSGFAPVAGATV